MIAITDKSSSRNSSCSRSDSALKRNSNSSLNQGPAKNDRSILLAILAFAICHLPFAIQAALPFHPYRQIVFPDGTGATRYANLGPLYAWLSSTNAAKPLPDWSLFINNALDEFTVLEVRPEGLLVRQEYHRWNAYLGSMQTAGGIMFLVNYPGYQACVDGQKIDFIAMLNGVYRYTDRVGTIRSLPRYDYGIPYDPIALARSSATNAPAATNSLGAPAPSPAR